MFFCENNFYSVQSPLWTRQPPRSLWKWAEGYGLPSVQVDGMNVLAVYEATREAVERARSGGGPTFIEAVCYRFRGAWWCGRRHRTGYRDQDERDAWDALDPRLAALSVSDGRRAVDRRRPRGDARRRSSTEVMDAFEFAMTSPNPVEADLVSACLR